MKLFNMDNVTNSMNFAQIQFIRESDICRNQFCWHKIQNNELYAMQQQQNYRYRIQQLDENQYNTLVDGMRTPKEKTSTQTTSLSLSQTIW